MRVGSRVRCFADATLLVASTFGCVFLCVKLGFAQPYQNQSTVGVPQAMPTPTATSEPQVYVEPEPTVAPVVPEPTDAPIVPDVTPAPIEEPVVAPSTSPAVAQPYAASKLVIKLNGKVASGVQKVIVGQKMLLSAAVQGSGSPSSPTWYYTAGSAVAKWQVTATSGKATPQPTAVSNKSSVSFYWTSGSQDASVTLHAKVGGADRSATVRFNVYRPNEALNVKTDLIQISGNLAPRPAINLRYGRNGVAPGIKFTAKPSTTQGLRGGSIVWCQVCKGFRTETKRNGVWKTLSTKLAGLDNAFPYPLGRGLTAEDSPEFGVSGLKSYKVTDSFTMWMMYKPPGAGAIPVPLRRVDWGFTANGYFQSNGKLAGDGHPTGSETSVDTTTYPTWVRVLHNAG